MVTLITLVHGLKTSYTIILYILVYFGGFFNERLIFMKCFAKDLFALMAVRGLVLVLFYEVHTTTA